nr:aspyridones efflux protein apdf [Quercus suber]
MEYHFDGFWRWRDAADAGCREEQRAVGAWAEWRPLRAREEADGVGEGNEEVMDSSGRGSMLCSSLLCYRRRPAVRTSPLMARWGFGCDEGVNHALRPSPTKTSLAVRARGAGPRRGYTEQSNDDAAGAILLATIVNQSSPQPSHISTINVSENPHRSPTRCFQWPKWIQKRLVTPRRQMDTEKADGSLNNEDRPEEVSEEDVNQKQADTPKAWQRVAGAWLLFFIAWGPALAYGSFQTYYSNDLLSSYSDSQLAWIGSLSTFLLICAGAFAGPFFDRGYLKHSLVAGCILLIFSLEMLSLCREYYQVMLAQALVLGIGTGLIYVPALAFVTISFPPKTRPWAVGILTSGAGVAGVLYPIMFDHLVPMVGFGWTCRIWGFISLALAIVALLLLLDAPVVKTKPRSLMDWSAFTEAPFAVMCVDTAALRAFIRGLTAWNFTAGIVVFHLLHQRRLHLWSPQSNPTSRYAGFVVWCFAVGYTSGMFISINPVVCALPTISPPQVLGTRFGIIWFASALGALICTPIAGVLADPETGDFLHAQIFTGCIMLVGAVLILIPWQLHRRSQMAQTNA